MNITFHEVAAKNFMTYAHLQLSLAGSGVSLITGRNLDNPAMDSNGAGKSTIRKAIEWGLFGATADGLDGDLIVNNQVGKACAVIVRFSIGGVEHKVVRYQKDPKHENALFLKIDGQDRRGATKKDTEASIVRHLGMTLKVFSEAISAGLESPFAGETGGTQTALLENIVGMDELDQAQDLARSEAERVGLLRKETEVDEARASQALLSATENLARIRKQVGGFEAERAEKLVLLKQEQEETQQALDSARAHSTLRKIEHIDKELKALAVVLQQEPELTQRLEKLQGQKEEAVELVTMLETELDGLNKRLRFLAPGQAAGEPCERCGQEVSGEVLKQHRRDRKGEIEVKTEERRSAEALREKIEERIHMVRKERNALRDTRERQGVLQDQKDSLAAKAREHEVRIAKIEAKLQELMRHEKVARKLDNPYSKLLPDAENDVHVAETKSAELRKALIAIRIELEDLQFWVKGFGARGLKNYVLDRIIPVLNQAVKKYTKVLAAGQLEVRFSTQTQIKSGEMRERFQVQVFNSHGADVYRGNSSGEKRRVDLAVKLALNDLICQRRNRQIRLLFLDEALDPLDSSGCERTISLVRELARDRKVFVVTHNPSLTPLFQNTITVEKKNGISSIT